VLAAVVLAAVVLAAVVLASVVLASVVLAAVVLASVVLASVMLLAGEFVVTVVFVVLDATIVSAGVAFVPTMYSRMILENRGY
jgi:hypothetical protein